MKPKPDLGLICNTSRANTDALHPQRVQQDLERITAASGFLGQYAEQLRIRFRSANERAVLNQWTSLYESADHLLTARNSMERRKSEHLQLDREHELGEAEKSTSLAKAQADLEEQHLRCEKAAYQRQHIERFVEGSISTQQAASDNQQRFKEADERRQLDAKWELNESLRSLHTLIELQHWRREQRNRILQDRSHSAEEQAEALQFVDDLYHGRHKALRDDIRIFEER